MGCGPFLTLTHPLQQGTAAGQTSLTVTLVYPINPKDMPTCKVRFTDFGSTVDRSLLVQGNVVALVDEKQQETKVQVQCVSPRWPADWMDRRTLIPVRVEFSLNGVDFSGDGEATVNGGTSTTAGTEATGRDDDRHQGQDRDQAKANQAQASGAVIFNYFRDVSVTHIFPNCGPCGGNSRLLITPHYLLQPSTVVYVCFQGESMVVVEGRALKDGKIACHTPALPSGLALDEGEAAYRIVKIGVSLNRDEFKHVNPANANTPGIIGHANSTDTSDPTSPGSHVSQAVSAAAELPSVRPIFEPHMLKPGHYMYFTDKPQGMSCQPHCGYVEGGTQLSLGALGFLNTGFCIVRFTFRATDLPAGLKPEIAELLGQGDSCTGGERAGSDSRRRQNASLRFSYRTSQRGIARMSSRDSKRSRSSDSSKPLVVNVQARWDSKGQVYKCTTPPCPRGGQVAQVCISLNGQDYFSNDMVEFTFTERPVIRQVRPTLMGCNFVTAVTLSLSQVPGPHSLVRLKFPVGGKVSEVVETVTAHTHLAREQLLGEQDELPPLALNADGSTTLPARESAKCSEIPSSTLPNQRTTLSFQSRKSSSSLVDVGAKTSPRASAVVSYESRREASKWLQCALPIPSLGQDPAAMISFVASYLTASLPVEVSIDRQEFAEAGNLLDPR